MTFLPIAERELRVAARRAGTYWLRCLVPLALMLIAAWMFLSMGRQTPQQTGMAIFYLLTGGLTLYALTAGLRTTADCLSEEKREGTLGLLFLTDLRGYDVVAGKLLANSLSVFYAVLAVLPVMGIPLLMGGVAGPEFGRLALVLINTLFFSLSAGMLASAYCKNARVAIVVALGIILVVAAGGPALGLLEWKWRDWQGRYEPLFLLPSPVFTYVAGLDLNYRTPLGKTFLWSLGIVHAIGWSSLLLASMVVRRKWQDRPASARTADWQRRGQNILEGGLWTRNDFRRECLDQNAFYWLATRPRSRAWWTWMPLLLASIGWGWGNYKLREDWFNPGIYAFTAFLLSLVMKAMIGAEAGRRLMEDRKIGALELLLSTPLSVREICHGQFLSLVRQFAAPLAVLLVADIALLIAGLRNPEMSASDSGYWLVAGIAGIIMFGADIVALYWMGMWLGVSSKNPRHAFGGAIAPILTLPWIATSICLTFISLLPYRVRDNFDFGTVTICLWFGFSMLADLGFGLYARHRLLRDFRLLAAQRFQRKRSFWRRLFGGAAT